MAMTRECLEVTQKSVIQDLQEQIERLELRLVQLEFALDEILGDSTEDIDDEIYPTWALRKAND